MIECIEYTFVGQDKLDIFFENAFYSNGFTFDPQEKHKELRNIAETYIKHGGGFWVLLDKDLVVGTVGLKIIDKNNKIGELKCMYLLKEYQGKGLGQMLIDKIIIESKKREIDCLRLDVKKSADKAIKLYKRNGFYEIPRYNENKNEVLFMETKINKWH